MDYLHTNPNAAIRYHASNMIFKFVSDAALLVLPKSRSRAAAIYHLRWINKNKKTASLTSSARPSKMSSLLPQKPKWEASTSAPDTAAQYASPASNEDTRNPQTEQPLRPMIAQHTAYYHPTCDPNSPKPSICGTGGSKRE